MIRSFVLGVLLSALLIAIGVVALGKPNLPAAGAVFSGGFVTTGDAIAAVEVVAWLVLVAAAIFVLALSMRAAATTTVLTYRRWSRGVLFLVLGICILGIGMARVHEAATTGCCGNIVEATNLAG